MFSASEGATTAPASINSSAHSGRVNIRSRSGSKLSPCECTARPTNPPHSRPHDNSAGYSASWLPSGAQGHYPESPQLSLIRRPFRTPLPGRFEHLNKKILPLARECRHSPSQHDLQHPLRQRQFNVRQLRNLNASERLGTPANAPSWKKLARPALRSDSFSLKKRDGRAGNDFGWVTATSLSNSAVTR